MACCVRALILSFAISLALSGCARNIRSENPSQAARHDDLQEGWASFYGADLKGNRTASGEKFDPSALTAAHRTLPLGSCVEVENAGNGRRVQVRVNDRGPYAKHRVIDVSLAAAQKLHMVEKGVAKVRLHPCS